MAFFHARPESGPRKPSTPGGAKGFHRVAALPLCRKDFRLIRLPARQTLDMDSDFNSRTRPPDTATPAVRPRRIRARRRSAMQWARLLGGLLATLLALTLLSGLSAWLGPQANALPGLSAPGGALLPMAAVALAWAARTRLGLWAGPAAALGLLAGTLPLALATSSSGWLAAWTRPEALPALLTALALPLLTGLTSRPLLRRLRLQQARPPAARRRWLAAALLIGLAAPLAGLALALGVLAALEQAAPPWRQGATIALGWALGGLGAAALLLAGPTARDGRRLGFALLAALALAATVLPGLSEAGAESPDQVAAPLTLLPHLLLCLLALRAPARRVAALGLLLQLGWLALHPLSISNAPVALALGLLPLLVTALQARARAAQPDWLQALDDHGLALAEWRWPGGLRQASAGWMALTGDAVADDDAPVSGSPLAWLARVHPRDRDAARRSLRQLLSTTAADSRRLTLRLAPGGGDWQPHELVMNVTRRDRRGRALGVIATLVNVGWRQTAADRERMTATLFDQVDNGIAVVDGQGRLMEANPAYCVLMHSHREQLIGRTALPLAGATLARNGLSNAQVQATLKAGKTWAAQLELELEDGTPLVLAAQLGSVPTHEGSPRWRVLTLSDLSETQQLRERLRRTRRFDAATGLPNREEFMRLLQQALAQATHDELKLVIALIDLDGFGRVNEEHGQLAADAVLHELSARLQSALRSGSARNHQAGDLIARLHGDEFAVLLHVQTPEEGQRAVDRLQALLATPVALRESQIGQTAALEISASLGATVFPFDNADPETLMRHAEHALYRAKQAGPGGCQFHDPTLQLQDEAGLIALARLQRALDGGELLLHYQPLIELHTGQVVAVEALLRWQHPERGLLAPAHFLPLVGHSGLAVQIGDWVLEQALAQAARWAELGLNLGSQGWRGLPICVNVGVRQLQRADFPQRLQELVQRQPPQIAALLQLDLLESDALAEPAAAQALIHRCQALGISVALDDFGAGYSRLAALKRLPVDTLKLDRSYVQGMLGDAQDLSLVESVLQLGRNIGCRVLAKGVESRAHARALLRLGCRLGQGNGIAAAMPAAELPGWLDEFARADWPARLRPPAQEPPPDGRTPATP